MLHSAYSSKSEDIISLGHSDSDKLYMVNRERRTHTDGLRARKNRGKKVEIKYRSGSEECSHEQARVAKTRQTPKRARQRMLSSFLSESSLSQSSPHGSPHTQFFRALLPEFAAKLFRWSAHEMPPDVDGETAAADFRTWIPTPKRSEPLAQNFRRSEDARASRAHWDVGYEPPRSGDNRTFLH